MKFTDILAICCYLLCATTICFGKRGFILTAPKVIDAGSTEHFTLTVFDVSHGGEASLRLLHRHSGALLAESKVTVLNNTNMWVEMDVPQMSSDTEAKLHIQGSFSDGYRIDAAKDVRIRHISVLTFIQTDKPLYKPGQTVKFRVLPMDSQLRPLAEDTVGDIWIEDSSNIRVAQWKNIKFANGMIQLELPLSDDPPLGTWSIKSLINKVSTVQTFKVETYVLPKFEVVLKPPAYVMADAEIISTEICAQYTYGKKVDGTFFAKITYDRRPREKGKIPSVEHSGQISGCHDFVVSSQDLSLHENKYGYRIIEIFAEVTENGTGIVKNASTKIEITHSPLHLEFSSSEGNADFFKPGLPFYGKLQVKRPDDIPAASEKIEICAISRFFHSDLDQKVCHTFTSNKEGMIQFSVAPKPPSVAKVKITAEAINYQAQKYVGVIWRDKIERPRAVLELSPWYSRSGSFLQIEPIVGELQCEKLQKVKIRYTTEKGNTITFYHQVLSRGGIVQQGSHQQTFYPMDQEERSYDLGNGHASLLTDWTFNNSSRRPDVGEFILSFDPRTTMSPIARLLIFYVREDGEVVADSRMFRVAKCLLNKVSLHFLHEQQYPSTEAAMMLSASPSSVCGIGLVDKSIRLLRQDAGFGKNKLFKLMETYDVGRKDEPRQVREEYCSQKVTDMFHDAPIPLRSSIRLSSCIPRWTSIGIPSFDDEEVLLDEEVRRGIRRGIRRGSSARRRNYEESGLFFPFSRSYSKYVDTTMAFDQAGMVIISDMELETRPCVQSCSRARFPARARARHNGPLQLLPNARVQPPPEAFLPSSSKPYKANPPKSIEEIRTYFPETWLWEMHTIGSSGEMSLKRQLPHTVTEWTGGAVCVHPKTGLGISDTSSITAFQPFFVSFQLPYSVVRGEVLPLVVSVFNYLTECLPIKLSLEPSDDYKILSDARYHKMCVCGEKSASNTFLLRPTTLGSVNVSVYGFSVEDDDEICGNEITARLSARDAITKQLLVEAEGFPKEEVFNYYVCPKNTNGSYATEVDLLLPENVIPGSARAYISVSGDLMGPALNGLRNLIRLPVGCGEQNMVLFVPNIFVLDYLTASGKITDEIEQECIKNMKTGYQRELQYRRSDGSYSAFGSRDKEGSLWLTTFVLRSFGQAKRFIYIDEFDLKLSIAWILDKQFENGCFEPTGFLVHKAMKGGLTESDNSLAPLTAYIVISLLESEAEKPEHGTIQNAFKCLEAEANPNIYGLALFAYANALANRTDVAIKYLEQLDKLAIKRGSQMYWEFQGKDSKSKSTSVEIAGYYILAHLQVQSAESIAEVLPAVRWVTKQRNSNGGFVSTQDTVVALQALAKYAALQSKNPTDLGLVIKGDEMVRDFKLDENNKLLTQIVKIPVLPTVIDLQAVGDGCSLVQFSLRYNVEKVSGSDAFDLSIDVFRLGTSDCHLPRIGICMRYKIIDQKSNMVVLHVKMASGFVPDEWSLQKLQTDETVQLKRHELDGNQVNLYFSELTNEQKCFTFFIKSEIEVEDVKPGIIKLYDYYQPELDITTEYVIPSACNVSSLPELPRLPPLIIDEDDDDVLFLNEMPSTAIPKDFGNYSESDINLTVATSVNDQTEIFNTMNLDRVQLSDDANQFESNRSSTHLDHFFDSTEDLNLFGGIEGNEPVSVPYLDDFPTTEASGESNQLDCPVCEKEFPENFTEIYCNSAFALRVIVSDGNSGIIKVLQDVSSYLAQPLPINKFAKIKYDDACSCTQLRNKGNILLLVGTPTTLWNNQEENHLIHLTRTVHVISTASKTVQTVQLTTGKSLCDADP